MTLTLKHCNGCHEDKPRCDFTNNRRAKDGLEWTCRACRIAGRTVRPKQQPPARVGENPDSQLAEMRDAVRCASTADVVEMCLELVGASSDPRMVRRELLRELSALR